MTAKDKRLSAIVDIVSFQVHRDAPASVGKLVGLDAEGNQYTFFCSCAGNLEVARTENGKPLPGCVIAPR